MRYWEDLAVGEMHHLGSHELTGDDVMAFTDRFFVPPAVVGADAAAVPGYLLCCVAMRLLVEHALNDMASLGSPGVDRLDWPSPAYVGDVLTLSTELLSTRVLRSRPEMGLARQYMALEKQGGEVVTRFWTHILIARREVSS